MHTIAVTLESLSPLMQSRKHNVEMLKKETHDAYERRTWMNKAHVKDGYVAIPSMALKRCLEEMAKHLGLQIPGKGKSTYTKHFVSGLMLQDFEYKTNVKIEDIGKQSIHCNSDGVRGSGKRVERFFPIINSWKCDVVFEVWDEVIVEEVFKEHLIQAGILKGIGSFRVGNGGMCGRFRPTKIEWSEVNV